MRGQIHYFWRRPRRLRSDWLQSVLNIFTQVAEVIVTVMQFVHMAALSTASPDIKLYTGIQIEKLWSFELWHLNIVDPKFFPKH